MRVGAVPAGKGKLCESILRSLPEWFGIEQAIVDYVAAVEALPLLAAYAGEAEQPVGFLALKPHTDHAGEIYVMGVRPESHGQGIGRRLVEAAEAWLCDRGCQFITVKTLSPAREYEPYERTRRFYRALGFVPIEEFPDLWGEANPCLMLIKPLEG